jgi:hypothetical protein
MHKQKVRTALPNVSDLNAETAVIGTLEVTSLDVSGLEIGGDTTIVQGDRGTLGTGITRTKLMGELVVEDLTIAETEVTITDNGDSDGGYGSHTLLTLPASHIILLGVLLEIDMTAGVGISATGAVKTAIGSAAEAADDTLDGTSGDYVASGSTTLVASAGSEELTGPVTKAMLIDATGGTSIMALNFGVADANISASSTLTISGSARIIYIDLSQGA